jgi:hypothetical protein
MSKFRKLPKVKAFPERLTVSVKLQSEVAENKNE